MTRINIVGGENQEKQPADAGVKHIQVVASLKSDLLLTCGTQIISASLRSSSDTVNGLTGSSHFNEAQPIFFRSVRRCGKVASCSLGQNICILSDGVLCAMKALIFF